MSMTKLVELVQKIEKVMDEYVWRNRILTDFHGAPHSQDMNTKKIHLRVLFDGMIAPQAILKQSVLVPTEFRWRDRTYRVDIAQDIPRTYRGQTREQTARKLDCLNCVADLAKTNRITCYSSQEIKFETWGLPRKYSFDPEANPFRDVRFTPCRLPYQRSVMFGGGGEDRFREEKEQFLAAIPDARFQSLNKSTGGYHAADCYHLWTAELNELDVFLTADEKFRNALRGQKKVSSAVEIMLPDELLGCSLLG
jgi:hypothetical protein